MVGWATNEVIAVLVFLLPGFVAAGVFQAMIPNPSPNGMSTLIRALIFTMVVQSLVSFLPGFMSASNESLSSDQMPSIFVSQLLVAILLGLGAAFAWNKNWVHKWLRRWGLTAESAYRSARYSAFAFNRDCYVVLHLKGERRLYGWPAEWPGATDDDYFLIEERAWLSEDGREFTREISHMLIPESQVEMIEFVPIEGLRKERKD